MNLWELVPKEEHEPCSWCHKLVNTSGGNWAYHTPRKLTTAEAVLHELANTPIKLINIKLKLIKGEEKS